MSPEYQTQQQAQDAVSEIASLHRTLRSLEDKVDNLRKKVQVIEKNMIDSDKKLFNEIRSTNTEVADMKHIIEDFKDKMKLVVKELKLGATKEEMEVLRKYLSYFEPVSFVTKNDLAREIEEKLAEHNIKN
jgi:hypothetical protein